MRNIQNFKKCRNFTSEVKILKNLYPPNTCHYSTSSFAKSNQLGTSLSIQKKHVLDDFTYLNSLLNLHNLKLNIGIFYGDKAVVGGKSKIGYMYGLETILNKKFHLVADHIAGKTPIGVSVIGFIFYIQPRIPLSFGYQLPNDKSLTGNIYVFELTYVPKEHKNKIRNKMKNKILTIVLLFSISTIVNAQTKSQNNNIWLHLVSKKMISKKTSLTFEGTMRYANGFSQKQQYFVRPSIDYQFTKILNGSFGFTHYNTFVYGSPALNKRPIPENHFWIQTNFTNQIGKFKFTNRLRDENRFVGIASLIPNSKEFEITEYKYRNRFRYMFTVSYPLINKNNKPLLNIIAGDEVFLNIGPLGTDISKNNVGKTLLNQNRIILGLGYIVNKSTQIQLSFINQNIWSFNDNIEESNPSLRISYLTNFKK